MREEPILISKGSNEEAKSATAFLNRYRNSGMLSVHRDCFDIYHQAERHHAIFTDVLAIADHPDFKVRFTAKLQALPGAPSLIVTPSHPAGKRLAEMAVAHFAQRGVKVPMFLHADLDIPAENAAEDDQASRHKIQILAAHDRLLILDDVSVTGRRLNRFLESLRTLNYGGNIHIIVGIAVPPLGTSGNAVCNSFASGKMAIHTPWIMQSPSSCLIGIGTVAWCAEMRLYAAMTISTAGCQTS